MYGMALHVQLRQKLVSQASRIFPCAHGHARLDRSNVYLESKPSDSSREISKSLYYECQVRGSFCERSEEYDVNTIVL